MSIPDKNNPDGLGSYGKSPSRFVERPRDQAKDLPNDATAAPMGHAGADQEVFDAAQQKPVRKPASPSNLPKSGQVGKGGKKNGMGKGDKA